MTARHQLLLLLLQASGQHTIPHTQRSTGRSAKSAVRQPGELDQWQNECCCS